MAKIRIIYLVGQGVGGANFSPTQRMMVLLRHCDRALIESCFFRIRNGCSFLHWESSIEVLQEVRACLTWLLTCCCMLSFTRGGTALNGKGGEP